MTRDVKNYEGLYSVDEQGNVFSYKRKKPALLVPCLNKFGYLNVCLRKDGKARVLKVHRLVAEAFLPNPGNKPQVNHKDGDKTNNCVQNLEWATASENVQHAVRNGFLGNLRGVKIVETGQVFRSLKDCAEHIRGDFGDISRCLKGKTQTHKGYHFEEVLL